MAVEVVCTFTVEESEKRHTIIMEFVQLIRLASGEDRGQKALWTTNHRGDRISVRAIAQEAETLVYTEAEHVRHAHLFALYQSRKSWRAITIR